MNTQGMSLVGYGYLDSVKLEGCEPVVHLCHIQHLGDEEGKTEDIWFECSLNAMVVDALAPYFAALASEQVVIVKFVAEYQRLSHCHFGLTPEDPERIVTMKVKLTKIHEVYINGVKQHPFLKAV